MNFKITPALTSNSQEILDTQIASWHVTFGGHMSKEEINNRFSNYDERLTGLTQRIKNQGEVKYFIAKEKNIFLGFIGFDTQNNQQHIRSLYLTPNSKGKGVGKALLLHSINEFDDTKSIILECREKNTASIGFYKHFGFEITKHLPQKPNDSFILLQMTRAAMVRKS